MDRKMNERNEILYNFLYPALQHTLEHIGVGNPDLLSSLSDEVLEHAIERFRDFFYLEDDDPYQKILDSDRKYVTGFSWFLVQYLLSYAEIDAVNCVSSLEYRSKSFDMPESEAFTDALNLDLPNIDGSVMIKPNLVSAYGYPETTDMGTLENVVSAVRCKNPKIPLVIADGPSLFFSSEMALSDKELKKISDRYDAEIVDLNKARYIPFSYGSDGDVFFIPEILTDIGCLVTIACAKSHNEAGFSGAVKNHFGLVAPFQRLMFHRDGKLLSHIFQIYSELAGNFHIIDARKVMRGAQQRIYGGYPDRGPGIFYSRDAHKIDHAAAGYAGGSVD
jgi:uncharacterized protein (DUF362 family)